MVLFDRRQESHHGTQSSLRFRILLPQLPNMTCPTPWMILSRQISGFLSLRKKSSQTGSAMPFGFPMGSDGQACPLCVVTVSSTGLLVSTISLVPLSSSLGRGDGKLEEICFVLFCFINGIGSEFPGFLHAYQAPH